MLYLQDCKLTRSGSSGLSQESNAEQAGKSYMLAACHTRHDEGFMLMYAAYKVDMMCR